MINLSEISKRKFLDTFKARTDRVVLYARNKQMSQQVKRGEFEIITRAEAHLAGTVRLGFYNMTEEDTVPWAVVNFNQTGDNQNIARDSALMVRELRKLGFRGIRRERTMLPNEDYNIWIFFDNPIAAKKVRHFLYLLIEKLGISKKTPVIPSEDELIVGSYGQHIWLPFFNGMDKWIDDKGNPYMCKGVKDNQTVFINEEGEPIQTDILPVGKTTEGDLDRALTALMGPLGNKYIPKVGLYLGEQVFHQMTKNCVALQKIIQQIEEIGMVSEEGLARLGILLKSLGLDDLLKRYSDKLQNYDEKSLEKIMVKYSGPAFPNCLDMKQIDFCPPGQNCFENKAPMTERIGMWREDPYSEKTIEPSMAPWFFESLASASSESGSDEDFSREMTGESPGGMESTSFEPQALSSPTKVKTIKLSEFLEEYESEIKLIKDNPKSLAGYNTGFASVNESIGGLIPGNLILISGPPGAGKSTFAKQMFDSVVEKEQIKGVFVTLDLTKEQLFRKTLARLSGVPLSSILVGGFKADEWAKIDKIIKYSKEKMGDSAIISEGDRNTCISSIDVTIKKTEAGFIVVDPIQALGGYSTVSNDKGSQDLMILWHLKQLAQKYSIPVIGVSNSELLPEHCYGADVIITLSPQIKPQIASSDKQPYAVLVNIEKNREGRSKITIQYTFYPPRMTFYGEKIIEYRPL